MPGIPNFSGIVKIFWISLSEFKPYKICNTSKLDSLILLFGLRSISRESERFSTELSGKLLYNSLHFNSKLTKKALSFGLEFLESATKLVENKRTQHKKTERYLKFLGEGGYLLLASISGMPKLSKKRQQTQDSY
jgi:hypothetical protein